MHFLNIFLWFQKIFYGFMDFLWIFMDLRQRIFKKSGLERAHCLPQEPLAPMKTSRRGEKKENVDG